MHLFVRVSLNYVWKKKDGWKQRWIESNNKKAEGSAGVWKWSAGKYSMNSENKGIKTGEDYRFYQLSTSFKEFSNEGKDLVLQFTVKNEQNLDCGGGYIKLLPTGFDKENFNGDTPYHIMFGPDICGATKRVHAILTYKGTNHLIKKTIPAKTDTYTHAYTFIIKPDQTYQILIDNEEVAAGNLVEDWDFLPPKTIKDPSLSKPADWVDDKEIPDPTATKPAGWDDIPELIVDPDASKPEDWDEELDGEWEAPLVSNPDYEGEWEAPMIPNPAYKGPWVHPMIDNPAYFTDDKIYAYSFGGAGFEIWQVKAGTIFDAILVTDDVKLAHERAADAIKAAKAEAAAEEAEQKAQEADAGADEDDDDEKEEEHDHAHDEL